MWLVDRIFAAIYEDISTMDTMMDLPYFDYDDSARELFQHIWVRIKKAGTSEYRDIKATPKTWGSLDEFLDKYNPHGCVRVSSHYIPEGVSYHLVVVDDMCYNFLDLVDSIEDVGLDYPLVKKAGKLFEDKNAVIALDSDKTLYALQPIRPLMKGGFPLLYIVMHYNKNWLKDENFYLRHGTGHHTVYRVNFYDVQKAKVYLAKAGVKFCTDPVARISRYLSALGMW